MSLTPLQVQQAYGLTTGSLQQMRIKLGGPKYTTEGRRVIYQADDVERWLKDKGMPRSYKIRTPTEALKSELRVINRRLSNALPADTKNSLTEAKRKIEREIEQRLFVRMDDAALAAEVNAMRSQMMKMSPKSPQYLALKPRAIAMKRELDSRRAKTAGNA